MVAVVDLTGEGAEPDRHERTGLDAFLAHALKETTPDIPAAYIVVDETHLDSLASLVNKHVGNEVAQGVVLKDIEIEMDALCCCP